MTQNFKLILSLTLLLLSSCKPNIKMEMEEVKCEPTDFINIVELDTKLNNVYNENGSTGIINWIKVNLTKERYVLDKSPSTDSLVIYRVANVIVQEIDKEGKANGQILFAWSEKKPSNSSLYRIKAFPAPIYEENIQVLIWKYKNCEKAYIE